jgi:prolyl oligopeptidase
MLRISCSFLTAAIAGVLFASAIHAQSSSSGKATQVALTQNGTQTGMQTQTVHGGNGITLPAPPPTAIHMTTEQIGGHAVEDPYRWLEDQQSPETRAWITEQNKYTQSYLSQIKDRGAITAALGRLQKVDEESTPTVRGGRYFYEKRLASENQASIYMRAGLHAPETKLIDPARLGDANTSVAIADVSDDGQLLVYEVRHGGADEGSYHVLRVDQGDEYLDVLPSARYSGVALAPDSKGLYYARFSHDGTTVNYHAFGTPFEQDTLLFGKQYKGEALGEMALIGANLSDDNHWLILSISRGVPATRQDILVKDLRKPDSAFTPLVYGVEAHMAAEEANDHFFLRTDYQAPNSKIVTLAPGDAPAAWKTVVPEGTDVIEGFSIAGGRMFVERLHDVKTETAIDTLDGQQVGTLAYPGIGTGSRVSGRPDSPEAFYSFQSFNLPPTIYRYDVKTGKAEVFFRPVVPFDSMDYDVRQVFYTSKDGTKVPMFIVGKKGLKHDGTERLLMTGYGGFDLPELPAWNPQYAWWLEQGGWFALPNLRGGDEYGEPWHKAAMFEKKKNVFDDWFAAAEYLIKNGYTSPKHFAIRGRSNGGLLMGASMTQRPELWGAIWCGYPLLDMLRYQHFEFGRLWTTEYGNADDPADFDYLRKYSPYQNVHSGTKYPAIMFFTGDSDTRVAPLHARKMTARVQAANGGDRPILLHYSLSGGHSSGVSLTQEIADETDELAFLWNETGPESLLAAGSSQLMRKSSPE